MMENAPRSRWARRLAAAVLVAVAAFAVAGPIVIGSDPAAQNLSATLRPPSQAAPLGTDQFGRSVLARLAQASQVSLALVVVSVVTAAIAGAALGLAAAWRGGWIRRTQREPQCAEAWAVRRGCDRRAEADSVVAG